MLLDAQELFSDDQAITATAVSTNVIDLGSDRDIGPGEDIPILVQITETFNNLTNLQIEIETDDNESFTSATSVYSETIALADLVEGARVWLRKFGANNEQFVRLNYTVTGTNPTAGRITAGFVHDLQEWVSHPGNN